MNYPLYRKLGLPITSSHMESAIKELNYLSGTDPLSVFWKERSENRTGFRRSAGSKKTAARLTAT